MDELGITEDEGGLTFAVRVVPTAERDRIVGIENGGLKVRLHAPAIDGRANRALIEFLAKIFGIARSRIEIVRGERGRNKVVKVKGVSREEVRGTLGYDAEMRRDKTECARRKPGIQRRQEPGSRISFRLVPRLLVRLRGD